jgi:hypothetical protein
MGEILSLQDIEREICLSDPPEEAALDEELSGLRLAFVHFDERIEQLDPKERRALIGVLSSRIATALHSVQTYVDRRLGTPMHRPVER